MESINIANCSHIRVLRGMYPAELGQSLVDDIAGHLQHAMVGFCVTNGTQTDANKSIKKLGGIPIVKFNGSYHVLTAWLIPGEFFKGWVKIPKHPLVLKGKKKKVKRG